MDAKVIATNTGHIQLLHPSMQPLVIVAIAEADQAGMPVRITRSVTSFAEQNRIYAQGRTTPGRIVTYARGGQSWHNVEPGRAIDVCFVIRGRTPYLEGDTDFNQMWRKLGAIFVAHGIEWGGNFTRISRGRVVPFPDRPHFQWTNGQSLKQAIAEMRGRKS